MFPFSAFVPSRISHRAVGTHLAGMLLAVAASGGLGDSWANSARGEDPPLSLQGAKPAPGKAPQAAPATKPVDPKVVAEFERLLTVGWNTSIKARAEADAIYSELRLAAPGSKTAYAYALVLMYQRRYAEAARTIDDVILGDKKNISAIRAKAWLQMLLKNYPAAMVEMEKLATIVADPSFDKTAERTATLAFIGRSTGYLEGPASAAANAAQVEAFAGRVAGRLNSEDRAAYLTQRAEVLEGFQAVKDEADITRQVEAAAEDEQKQKTLEDVDKLRQELSSRSSELGESKGKIESEYQAAASKLAEQERPLALALAQLDGRIRAVRGDLATLSLQIGDLRFRADETRDGFERDRLLREADRLNLIALSRQSVLRGLEAEASVVIGQRNAILQQAAALQNVANAKLSAIATELKGIDKRARLANVKEGQASKPSTGNTGRVRALSTQAGSYSSYEPFPLEEERQKLLAP